MKLTIALIICAVLTLAYMLSKIRKGQIKTADAVFWFIFAACLVIVAIFPQIVFFVSDLLGVESPANLVFLCVVAVLVIREFGSTVKIAKLQSRVEQLVQYEALNDCDTNQK